MTPLRKLAFVVNRTKRGAHDLANDLVALARTAKVKTKLFAHTPLAEGASGSPSALNRACATTIRSPSTPHVPVQEYGRA